MDKLAHRKATARILAVGADGTPLKNTPVSLNQTSHSFLFGCGAFHTVPLTKVRDEAQKAELQDQMDKWLALFNYATLPFYWGQYEPKEGRPRQDDLMGAARYLKEKGVAVKGHPLCWHTACADWLMAYPNDVILEKQLARIHRDVTAFMGVIDMWDVINEVVIMPVFDKYDNAITRVCRDKGRIGLVKAVFARAKADNPGATLLINDFNTSVSYEILLEGLLEAGVPISAIGIQSHQHQGYWGLEKLLDVLERFSRFGLPIHFTENTLISGELMPAHIVDLNDFQVKSWPTTPEGEARQAREATEMYSTLFASPRVEAITSWDFKDGGWLGAPSGLVRADNSPKPAYEALKDLIHGQWETHETLVTDENGCLTLTGFKGGYEARCGGASARFALEKDGDIRLQMI